MLHFFDLLDYHGLSNSKFESRVRLLSSSQIEGIANALTESLEYGSVKEKESFFDLYLGGSLNGHYSYGCRSQTCRLTRLNKTSIFSALYSETSYIPNFFSNYYHQIRNKSIGQVRSIFTSDLLIVNSLRKVFEKSL